ncbi:MAG: TetR family transcriptional regulator C-terminal domain-containing protein [Silicimonas sp.]|nr:TetR family transcriptional regulator C-terminal domain-containing protein [Silicimonas sp.]
MTIQQPRTRIQKKNRWTILDAALDVFSDNGFRGATLDQIAASAGLSKPNVLYYFSSKEAIYTALLSGLLETWLDPLRAIDPEGDAVDEILAYVRRKLDMSREFPRESRLFANEIVQGAPHIIDQIEGPLKDLVDGTCALLRRWMNSGDLAPFDPYHLIFSIWATTQHYADFNVQVAGILQTDQDTQFGTAADFLDEFYRRALTPVSG